MATEITMPKLSDTMTEGALVAWKKAVGDRIERGDVIAEVETDKAVMELEAFASGVLLEIRVKANQLVPVGTVIGIIGEPGEAAIPKTPQPQAVEEPPPAESAPKTPPPPSTEPATTPGPQEHPLAEKASPLVRRLAREHGIDLTLVQASGPEGRILQEDVERYIAQQTGVAIGLEDLTQQPPAVPSETEEPKALAPEGVALPLSRMRAAIAKRVVESWRTTPHFNVTVAVEMGEGERVRQELKGTGTVISHNDLLVKGVAMALARFPKVNSSFNSEGIVTHTAMNIGIAVALDDGLVVPVIKDCDRLSLKEIAIASQALIAKARNGKLSETELTGGTFTISNLGMFGVDEFTAVIMPPQGAILAVGAITDQTVVRNGSITAARMMRVTLSADHRLLDGAEAAKFLAELRRIMENPVQMLV
jgi:pyruvate dehydrogenase E2 component (dihydrolipoamide acetyltransferase)